MAKGKNFSANNASGKRRKSDFYETPYSLTRLLLDNVKLKGLVLEPAYGHGAIGKVLSERKYDYISYDISTGSDFLEELHRYPTVITNPPYSLAGDFIKKAQEISDEIFFLLPLSYLHGKKRYDDFWTNKEFPLKKIFVFTRYPMLGDELREDGKHRTGMMVYAWFWWKKDHVGQPTIEWLDNNDCVIRKGE